MAKSENIKYLLLGSDLLLFCLENLAGGHTCIIARCLPVCLVPVPDKYSQSYLSHSVLLGRLQIGSSTLFHSY